MTKDILDVVLAIVQILSLIALVVYVIKTWHMASATRSSAEAAQKTLDELRDGRDQETAPYVVTYFEASPQTSLIYLVIKNIGRTIAKDIRLVFDPPLKSTQAAFQLGDLAAIREGISSMPPGYEIRTAFDSAITYFGNPELPLLFRASVSYSGGLREIKREHPQTLDLQILKGLVLANEKGIDEVISTLEKLVKESSSANTIRRERLALLRPQMVLRERSTARFGWRPKTRRED